MSILDYKNTSIRFLRMYAIKNSTTFCTQMLLLWFKTLHFSHTKMQIIFNNWFGSIHNDNIYSLHYLKSFFRFFINTKCFTRYVTIKINEGDLQNFEDYKMLLIRKNPMQLQHAISNSICFPFTFVLQFDIKLLLHLLQETLRNQV